MVSREIIVIRQRSGTPLSQELKTNKTLEKLGLKYDESRPLSPQSQVPSAKDRKIILRKIDRKVNTPQPEVLPVRNIGDEQYAKMLKSVTAPQSPPSELIQEMRCSSAPLQTPYVKMDQSIPVSPPSERNHTRESPGRHGKWLKLAS